MTITLLELHCLNAISDDYENLDSITLDVRRVTHGNVSKEEMEACLRNLVNRAFVTAFDYDVTQEKFVPVLEGEVSGKWFFISREGQAELNQNWVDDP